MKYLIFAGAIVLHFATAQVHDIPIPCSTNEDCTSMPGIAETATCSNNVCMCPDGNNQLQNCNHSAANLFPDPKTTIGLVGRTCKLDKDCNVENAYCETSRHQCACSIDFTASIDNKKCLRIAETMGSGCDEDQQCTAKLRNTTCSNRECKCAKDFYFMRNACWNKIKIGNSCTVNEECEHVSGAECGGQKLCECSKGAVINFDEERCLPIATNRDSPCLESIQCSTAFGNSHCRDKKCECHEHYHFYALIKKCIANKGLGESCTEDHECNQSMDEDDDKSMTCHLGYCSCSYGFVREDTECVMQSGASMGTVSVAIALSIFLSLLL